MEYNERWKWFSIIKGTLVVLTKSSIERNKSYHLKAGDILVKEPSVGGYVTYGSYRGLFHTIVGLGSSHVAGGAMYEDGACSRLS